ncbi:unnamed protein product [Closterium sp. NIES-54]
MSAEGAARWRFWVVGPGGPASAAVKTAAASVAVVFSCVARACPPSTRSSAATTRDSTAVARSSGGVRRVPPSRRSTAEADAYNTWYLDCCCRQHMVGSKRFISNARPILQPTVFPVANNQQLEARACGIVVLKAHDSDVHITLNDMLIVQDLEFNLLSYEQLVQSGVLMTTDPESRCILMHWKDYIILDSKPRYIGKAHPDNGVYILDFDIPDCRADSGDLIDLQPQHNMGSQCPVHPDGRPWVKHHAHPKEIDLHALGLDGLCRNCRTPTASTT